MTTLESYRWFLLVGLLIAGWLLYLLAPILSPFMFAALLAYLGDPLVDKLEAGRLPRVLSATIVFTLMFSVVVIVPLILLPVIETQLSVLVRSLPGYIDWVTETFLPTLQQRLGVDPDQFDVARIKAALMDNWKDTGSIAANVVAYISNSGLAMLLWLANIVLVPVLTFYMLVDWDRFVAAIRDLLPRSVEPTATKLSLQSDEMLSAFLRGQLLVMLSLGLIYSIGLSIIGLKTAVLIGLLAGLVSFVPYLGVIVGLIAASVAMLFQTQDAMQLVPVAIVFGVGQMLEGMVLTPWLVGDKIGLHPVTVMFAVLAGGQLFGFVGILLALPIASVLVVLVRHVRERYQASDLYRVGE
ncbi:Putative permease often clustered with de novo purine synthesis [hydrothermal vent metagenome]|uniref:Permease often clustered with de novo purine synthesis n=1 Tax=hydrothermal vent metagenome TaxID=652676 RepID=A0A3B0YTH7_9ZZZZ